MSHSFKMRNSRRFDELHLLIQQKGSRSGSIAGLTRYLHVSEFSIHLEKVVACTVPASHASWAFRHRLAAFQASQMLWTPSAAPMFQTSNSLLLSLPAHLMQCCGCVHLEPKILSRSQPLSFLQALRAVSDILCSSRQVSLSSACPKQGRDLRWSGL